MFGIGVKEVIIIVLVLALLYAVVRIPTVSRQTTKLPKDSDDAQDRVGE